MLKNIPNAITLLNLISGSLGIVFLIQGNISYSIYMILISTLFDFLDGSTARLLNAYSNIGKTLDSLADMVSFGLLPGMLLYVSLSNSEANSLIPGFLPYNGIVVPVFAAIRLAIFDNDDKQKENFRGLPVPANALFIASMAYIYLFIPESFLHFDALSYTYLCVGSSIMQVILIGFISLKFKEFGIKANLERYAILVFAIAAITIFHWEGLALTIGFYIALSIFTAKKEEE